MIVLSEVSFLIRVTVRIPCTLRSNLFYIKSICCPNSSVSLVTLNRDPLGRTTKRHVDIQSLFHLSCATLSEDTSSSTTSKLSKHRDGTQDVRVNLQRRTYIDRNIQKYRAHFEILCRRRQIKIYGETLSSSKCNSSQQISTFLNEPRCQSPYHIESHSGSRCPHRLLLLLSHEMKNFKTVLWCKVSFGKKRSARWQFRSLDQKLFESRITIWLMM